MSRKSPDAAGASSQSACKSVHKARWLAAVILLFLAPATAQFFPEDAYGQQTPETPRPRPSLPSSTRPIRLQPGGYDQSGQYGDSQPNEPGRSRTGRFGDRRSDRDRDRDTEQQQGTASQQGQQPSEQPQQEQPQEQKPPGPREAGGREGGGGPTVIGPGAAGRGGAAEGAGAPGLPGAPGAGAAAGPGGLGAAGGLPRGPAAGVNVISTTSFEPAFEHEVEYPDVPDAGAENLITEEGPMTVLEFLSLIHLSTEWNIISTEKANAVRLSFYLIDTTPKQALKVLEKHDVYYEWDEQNKYLYVMTKEEYLTEKYAKVSPTPTEFKVVHADVTYAESMLSSLLSQAGRIVTDQRTNLVYVWDTEDNLEQMKKAFEELDVPLEKREFLARYADLADVEAVVTSLLSANGSFVSDPRTAQFFVWDSPAVLDRVAEAVARLDVPIEPVTYEVKHVSAEDLVDSLEVLLSERGLIQVDPRYNTIVVTDLQERQARIASLIETLDRELETRTWVIQYADIEFIADQIETYIPSEMGEIMVNDMVHQVTVTGLPERLDKIDALIKVWDIKRQQVMIEAFLVDVGESVAREFNIRWSYFDNANAGPVAINSPTGGFPGVNADVITYGQLPYAVPLYGNLQLDAEGNITRPVLTDIAGNTIIDHYRGNQIGAALNYLDRTTDLSILAAPRVTVQDGEEAIFENAERVPYASATSSYGGYYGGYGGAYSRVEFIDVGIILRVKPQITELDDILLDIAAEDSSAELVEIESYSTGTEDTVSSRKAPQVKARNVETQLRIHSGDTVVLGGLRQSSAGENINRVPILGDIPVVGRLFKYPSKSSDTNTLMIFLTPTIVDEHTFPEASMLTDAEEDIAARHRHNRKDFYERIRDRITHGEHEVSVSIGQTGCVHSEGQPVTMDELRKALESVTDREDITLVLRRHPRAPSKVVAEVVEIAMELDIKVDFDDAMMPLVPTNHSAEAARAAAESASAETVVAAPAAAAETPEAEVASTGALAAEATDGS